MQDRLLELLVWCVRKGVSTCCDRCWVIFRLPARVSCLYCLTQHLNFAGVVVEFEPKRKFELFWSVQGEWKLLFYSSNTQIWQYTYPKKYGCKSIFFLLIIFTMRSKTVHSQPRTATSTPHSTSSNVSMAISNSSQIPRLTPRRWVIGRNRLG